MLESFLKEPEERIVNRAKPVVLTPKIALFTLCLIILVLSLINLIISFLRYNLTLESYNHLNILITIFSLDREQNVPTYFSTIILLVAALLLAYLFVLSWHRAELNKKYWGPLALLFLLLSMEEYIGLHELSNDPFKDLIGLNSGSSSSWLHYAWVIPAFVLAVAVGLYFVKFLFRLPIVTRRRFIFSGTLYVAATLGFELIGGHFTATIGVNNFLYALIATLEEVLEMFAISFFIFALLDYLKHSCRQGLQILIR